MDEQVCLGLTGSVFTNSRSYFAEMTIQKLKQNNVNFHIVFLVDTVLGTLTKIVDSDVELELPLEDTCTSKKTKLDSINLQELDLNDNSSTVNEMAIRKRLQDTVLPIMNGLPDTEQRNIRSQYLSTMPLDEAVELMIEEENRANRSLREHVSSIVTLVERITVAFKTGGRLFYVGAGTSGRLGILDASECPPTFKTPKHWVQGMTRYTSIAVKPNYSFVFQVSLPEGPKQFNLQSSRRRTR